MLHKAPISGKQQSVFLENQGCYFTKGVIQLCLNPLTSKAHFPGVFPDYLATFGFSIKKKKEKKCLENESLI